jgi:hypothetical protein
MTWKIRCELARDGLNSFDDAARKIAGCEIGFHCRADFSPAGATYFRVDAAVGNDLDLAIGEQQINQHAVVMRGVPDPKMLKIVERTCASRLIRKQRLAVERTFDDETHLAGMRGLACLDRLLDQGQRLLRENATRPPVMLDQVFADPLDSHLVVRF